MSVINQMLRDLDARRSPQGASNVSGGGGGGAGGGADAPALPQRRHGSPRSRRLPVIVLAGTVAIGAAAYGDWPGLLSGRANAATARAPVPVMFDATRTPAPLPDSAQPVAAREAAPLPSENRPEIGRAHV